MNRLRKILTLGLEKKRAWQLPMIAGLLVLFSLGVCWWYNSRAVKGIRLVDMVDIGDIDGVRWICRWDSEQVNEVADIAEEELDESLFIDYWPILPLFLAIHRGHTDITKVLIEFGAEVNTKVELDLGAGEYCVPKYHKEETSVTALDWATERGQVESVEALIKAGAEVNAKDEDGEMPLHKAMLPFLGDTELIKVLIQGGADVNAKCTTGLDFSGSRKENRPGLYTSGGWTPLHMSVINGKVPLVAVLIKSGASIDARENEGRTPLHWAATLGRTEMAKILLKAGADVNAKTKYGTTPLHWAAFKGNTEMVKILLKAGAEVNARDKDGETPLDSAHKEEMIDLLRKHGAKTGAELDAEAKQGKQE